MEDLAKKYIVGESVPIFSILQATRKVYSKLPHGECWLHDYLYTKLQAAFALDKSTFTCAVESDEQPVEPCAVEPDEQPVEPRAVTMLPDDIGLYVNWTNLGLMERKERKRILRKKMLPVPNRDGAFS